VAYKPKRNRWLGYYKDNISDDEIKRFIDDDVILGISNHQWTQNDKDFIFISQKFDL
jgi:hypothetical protein